MITIVFGESELELIPERIRSHPVVISSARRRNRLVDTMILDSNYHHAALRYIDDSERRGRPDIIHISLLVTLESIANKRGIVKTLVHTRNNDVIYIDKTIRIMRNYSRFIGLMEQLFIKKVIPSESHPLLLIKKDTSLEDLIEEQNADRVVVCSSRGREVRIHDYIKEISHEKNILFVIGGFPNGNFKSSFEGIEHDRISIYNGPLMAWTVAGEILSSYNSTV